ncbi:Fcf1-domain-containing protein [Lipomyces tetrasporus]|uniref:U three protein 23 n=1 Tax=Lipomyces tetrasporus TaxID=54092 RepID=A0AAD7QW67_9ASCO|nr:Fcf1-domain-containing protein [Lipomyces tetrasporus]KAJ8102642.1 Fcf1-domain-containing protein [Lipomyces tetrasporus]
MRQKRSKSYRKQMATYNMAFGFRQPYQVLVDGDIIYDATKYKMNLDKSLESVVQGKIKPMITQCCIKSLYDRGEDAKDAIALAKTFERRRCNHLDTPLSQADCLNSVVNVKGKNKHRYVIATQDPRVRSQFRAIPATPMIYINRSVIIMEPMSPATEAAKRRLEAEKLSAGLNNPRTRG